MLPRVLHACSQSPFNSWFTFFTLRMLARMHVHVHQHTSRCGNKQASTQTWFFRTFFWDPPVTRSLNKVLQLFSAVRHCKNFFHKSEGTEVRTLKQNSATMCPMALIFSLGCYVTLDTEAYNLLPSTSLVEGTLTSEKKIHLFANRCLF